MATDIAAGMLHLHKENEGIVHRDLATRNLLVKKIQRREGVDYEVKVTDIGLSRKRMKLGLQKQTCLSSGQLLNR